MSNEYLSCVNEDGFELQPRLRHECHRDPGLLHRVIHILVENSHGKFLLQRRGEQREIQPGKWDISVGGHVSPGERTVEAAMRECQEELGVTPAELEELYTYTWLSDIESERVTTYYFIGEGPFNPDPDEIDEVAFFSVEQIDGLIQDNKVTPNFIFEWTRFKQRSRNPHYIRTDYPIYSMCRCDKCPRLTHFREKIVGKGRLIDEAYWNRPVPGFGDLDASTLIVGLAPGAHGANRTGRPFTGDAAGDVLFQALFECGMSTRPKADKRGDGLCLSNAFITNAVKCVPPDNQPKRDEVEMCMKWFSTELDVLVRVRKIICLGRLAFETVKKSFVLRNPDYDRWRSIKFQHGLTHALPLGLPQLAGLYHPSRRNVNTGLITERSFCHDFKQLCKDA